MSFNLNCCVLFIYLFPRRDFQLFRIVVGKRAEMLAERSSNRSSCTSIVPTNDLQRSILMFARLSCAQGCCSN